MEKIKAFFVMIGHWFIYTWQKIEFTFWKLVWWWKKQTGMLDMGQEITITGTMLWSDFGKNPDGDWTMHVKLDPGYERYITLGDRLTTADPAYPATLHCEVFPWMRAQLIENLTQLQVGSRVKITGGWVFDGVHLGKHQIIEILAALWRHPANMRDGWFEIHGINSIEVL